MHRQIHSTARPLACLHPGCGKAFARASGLRSHQKTHSTERPFTCLYPGCGKAFKRRSELRTHGRAHSEERPFPCPSCPGTFKSSADRASHQLSHSKERRWACPHCGETYLRSGQLTIHIRTHTQETPYHCRYCPKEFRGSGELAKHERVHSKERPYACPICLERFTQISNRNTHVRGQHRAYNCPHCTMAFTSSDELKDHGCSGSKDYICFGCGAAFPDSGLLSTHERRTHTRDKSQQKHPATSGRMRQGEWYRKLEEYLGAWEGRCAFCSMHNLGDTGHFMNVCVEEGIQRVRDKCTRLQKELPKKGYQGCHLCYLPLRICDHWESRGDETGWRESETEVCQFSGLVNPAVATLLVQNEAGSISTSFDLVDIGDCLNQPSEAIYEWLRRRWGETEASWNIQLFFRISAALNIKKTADATTTLPNSDNTLCSEDVANIDPWLLALDDEQ
jgi:hypothetical protein